MGFSRAMVDVTCDRCGLDSEPVEAQATQGAYSLSLEAARQGLENDGWRCDVDGRLTCSDCVYEMDMDQEDAHGQDEA